MQSIIVSSLNNLLLQHFDADTGIIRDEKTVLLWLHIASRMCCEVKKC